MSKTPEIHRNSYYASTIEATLAWMDSVYSDDLRELIIDGRYKDKTTRTIKYQLFKLLNEVIKEPNCAVIEQLLNEFDEKFTLDETKALLIPCLDQRVEPVLKQILGRCDPEGIRDCSEYLTQEWMLPITIPVLKKLMSDIVIVISTPTESLGALERYGVKIDLVKLFCKYLVAEDYDRIRSYLTRNGSLIPKELLPFKVTQELKKSEKFFVIYGDHSALRPELQRAIQTAKKVEDWFPFVNNDDLEHLPSYALHQVLYTFRSNKVLNLID